MALLSLGKVQVFCKNVELHIVRAELQYDLSQQLLHFFNSDEVLGLLL